MMRVSLYAVVFLLAFVRNLAGNTVVELDDQSFHGALENSSGLWLLYFYAPWCGYCKKMTPIMENIADKLSNSVTVGKIDGTVSTATATEFAVKSYPTIKYFKDGFFGDFEGNKSFTGIEQFVSRVHGSPVITIQSKNDMEGALDKCGVLFVLSYHATDSVSLDAFESAAETLKLKACFASSEQDHIEQTSLSKYEAHRKVFSMQVDAAGFDKDRIIEFVESHNHLLVNTIDKSNFRTLGRTGKPLVLAIVDYKQEAMASDLIIALDEAASDLDADEAHKLIFGHMDGLRWRNFLRKFGATVPSILVMDLSVNGYHVAKGQLNVDSVKRVVVGALSKGLAYEEVDHPDMTIVDRIRKKMQRNYPWSAILCALPVVLLLVSALFPHPSSTKEKNS